MMVFTCREDTPCGLGMMGRLFCTAHYFLRCMHFFFKEREKYLREGMILGLVACAKIDGDASN